MKRKDRVKKIALTGMDRKGSYITENVVRLLGDIKKKSTIKVWQYPNSSMISISVASSSKKVLGGVHVRVYASGAIEITKCDSSEMVIKPFIGGFRIQP